jgi:D-xylose transport system substrate-binding protein
MDAQLDALQRIAQGEQSMTVYKPIKPLAFAAVEAAIKLAKGEKLDTTRTMKAKEREIPFIFIEPKVVDKSNLMDIVRDGYEKYDAIFANIPADQRPRVE